MAPSRAKPHRVTLDDAGREQKFPAYRGRDFSVSKGAFVSRLLILWMISLALDTWKPDEDEDIAYRKIGGPKTGGPRCIRGIAGPYVFVLAKNVWYKPVT